MAESITVVELVTDGSELPDVGPLEGLVVFSKDWPERLELVKVETASVVFTMLSLDKEGLDVVDAANALSVELACVVAETVALAGVVESSSLVVVAVMLAVLVVECVAFV